MKRWLFALHLALPIALGAVGCTPARSPSATTRSPEAQKWLDRTKSSYASGDMEDAWDAAQSAMRSSPKDPEALLWAARVALARLDYDEVVRVLKDVPGSEARGLRGRADWYAGRIEAAADELEAMLQDPEVRDGWAKAIAGLARRGVGRKPFQISGGMISPSEMVHLPGSQIMVVPLEIDGEEGLAMVATGSAEVALDSTTRKDPSWVSLRFGHRMEIKDVPAVVQDLSAISRRLNAPIKALLGINLLRHLNPTIDYSGGQFVIRTFRPPVPPQATRVPLYYIKGGGMMVKSVLQSSKDAPSAILMVDSSSPFSVTLDQDGWKKAGVAVTALTPVAEDPKLKQGLVPLLRLGGMDLGDVTGLYGTGLDDLEKGMQTDLDGVLGAGLLSQYRITLTDEGRAMWLEDVPMPAVLMQQHAPEPPRAPDAAEPPIPAPPAKPGGLRLNPPTGRSTGTTTPGGTGSQGKKPSDRAPRKDPAPE